MTERSAEVATVPVSRGPILSSAGTLVNRLKLTLDAVGYIRFHSILLDFATLAPGGENPSI